MGLIRKSLRVGLAVTSPLTAASVGNVKAESKKQRRQKEIMSNTARMAAALEHKAAEPQVRSGEPVLGTPRAQANPAVKIAQQRYASGEITREEFLQIKADLES